MTVALLSSYYHLKILVVGNTTQDRRLNAKNMKMIKETMELAGSGYDDVDEDTVKDDERHRTSKTKSSPGIIALLATVCHIV